MARVAIPLRCLTTIFLALAANLRRCPSLNLGFLPHFQRAHVSLRFHFKPAVLIYVLAAVHIWRRTARISTRRSVSCQYREREFSDN